MNKLAEALTDVYLNRETWHNNILPKEEANRYHEALLMTQNIFTYVEDEELLGYVEFWRINREQLARLVLNESVYALEEDIHTGEIAYINNMWITPSERNGHVFNILGNLFLDKNRDAKYFVTFRGTKHNKPIQVYKREDLLKLYKEI